MYVGAIGDFLLCVRLLYLWDTASLLRALRTLVLVIQARLHWAHGNLAENTTPDAGFVHTSSLMGLEVGMSKTDYRQHIGPIGEQAVGIHYTIIVAGTPKP